MNFLFLCLRRFYSSPRVKKTSLTLVNWTQLISSLSLDIQLIFKIIIIIYIYIYISHLGRSPVGIGNFTLFELRGRRHPIVQFPQRELIAVMNGMVLLSVLVQRRAKSQILFLIRTLLSFSLFLSFSSPLPLLLSLLLRVDFLFLPYIKG